MRTRVICAAAIAAALTGVVRAERLTASAVLRRVQAYVETSDRVLEAVVADEHYVQKIVSPTAAGRSLDSEFAWVRLPELNEAVGVREVRTVDGAPAGAPSRLRALLEGPSAERAASVRAILNESARYNLGVLARNVNFPTFPFAYIRRPHSADLKWRLGAPGERVELRFTDRGRRTVVRTGGGRPVPAEGTFVVDPATGRIDSCRVQLSPPAERDHGQLAQPLVTLSIRFEPNDRLGIAVPAAMTERLEEMGARSFEVGQVLTGEATYTNYRRFETEGRLVGP